MLFPLFPLCRLLVIFLLSLTSVPVPVQSQDDALTCTDSSLETYLVALIDTLYYNGLSTTEELIVHLSESDEGYALLESLYSSSSSSYTFLAPTDSAWQSANIYPPFSTLSNATLAQIFALHTVSGDWEYTQLGGGHNIASSLLSVESAMNATTTGASTSTSTSTSVAAGEASESTAYQVVVLEQGASNEMVVQSDWSNATSWGGKVDNDNDALGNLVILPIDKLLTFPPNVSSALAQYGLTNLSAAFDVVSLTEEVEQLTSGGFTLFAPLDSGFTDAIKARLGDGSTAGDVVENLYTTNYSFYSSQWSSAFTLPLSSGESVTVSSNDTGTFVSLEDVQAKVLRSDITLQNGVMHIIDTVLVSNGTSNSTTDAAGAVAAATASASGLVATVAASGGTTANASSVPVTTATATVVATNNASPRHHATSPSAKIGLMVGAISLLTWS